MRRPDRGSEDGGPGRLPRIRHAIARDGPGQGVAAGRGEAQGRDGAEAPRRQDLSALLGDAAPDLLALAVAAYLSVPALIFAAGWFTPPLALGVGVAGVAALWLAPWRARMPAPAHRLALCLVLGLLWAVLASGTHHGLHAAADWQVRDAVLRDLSLPPWPVAYALGEQEWLLRAPLGYYMPAALAGRAAGFGAAQVALYLWTALGLALLLMLLDAIARRIGRGRRGAFVLLALVFVVFGGLDIIPNVILDSRAGAGAFASWGRGGEWWDRVFQYSGHVTLLVWAPNHALPAWLCSLLVLRHGRHPDFARGAATPIAGAMFWTPLGAVGAALLALVAMLRRPFGPVLRAWLAPANLLAAACSLPLMAFLTAGSAAISHGWLLARLDPAAGLARWALLLALEVLPWALGIGLALRGGRLFRAALVLLVALPAYVFGPGNEMTMRTGIAPLAVLAVSATAALLAPGASRIARALLVATLLLGALGQAMEASLLVAHPPWRASRDCSLPEAAAQSAFAGTTDWSHYVVPWPERTLRHLLREPDARGLHPSVLARCWGR